MANIDFERDRSRRNQQMWDAQEREKRQLARIDAFQKRLKNTTKRSERTALTSAFQASSQERRVAAQEFGATNRTRMNNAGEMARTQWSANFANKNMTADQRERNRLTDIRDRFSRNLQARKFNEDRLKNDRFTYKVTDPETQETIQKVGYYSQGAKNQKIASLMNTLGQAKDMGKAFAAMSPEDQALVTGYRQFQRGNMPVPAFNGAGQAGAGAQPTTKDVFHVGVDAEGNPVYSNTKVPVGAVSPTTTISDTGANSPDAKVQQIAPAKDKYAGIPKTGHVMKLPPAPKGAVPDPYILQRISNALNIGGPEAKKKRNLAANIKEYGGTVFGQPRTATWTRKGGTIPRAGQGWKPGWGSDKQPRTFRNNLSGRLDRITYDALRGGFRNF